MLENILPKNLTEQIEGLRYDKLYELRLRRNLPVKMCYGGEFFFLRSGGELSKTHENAVIATGADLETVLFRACDYSVYAANEQLKQGFLTTSGGIRIGVAGSVVSENADAVTVKEVTSLAIRVPHEIEGCSAEAFKHIFGDGRVRNTLLISPPGAGKTTFLKDIVRKLGAAAPFLNVLVLDERGEFDRLKEHNADFIRYSQKSYAVTMGVRSLRPDVIICDELGGCKDAETVERALTMGVKVIASAHAADIGDLKCARRWQGIERLFERVILLSAYPKIGTVAGVYGGDLRQLLFTAM